MQTESSITEWTQETVLAKMEKLCRSCLIEGASEDLFSSDDSLSNQNYPDMITSCTGVSITENDGLPQHICSMCANDISSLFKFRKRCRKIDTYLRKLLQDNSLNGVEELQTSVVNREKSVNVTDSADIMYDKKVTVNQIVSRKSRNFKKQKKNLQLVNQPSVVLQDLRHDCDDGADCGSSDFDSLHYMTGRDGDKSILNISKKSKRGLAANAFSCRKCELHFLSWKELSDHNSKHLPITQEETLSCRYCKQIFCHQRNLIPHFKQAHGEIPRFQCGYCGEKWNEFKDLKRHLTMHRPGDAVIDIEITKESGENDSKLVDPEYDVDNVAKKGGELYIKIEVPPSSAHFETEECYPPIIDVKMLETESDKVELNTATNNQKRNVADTLICYTCKQLFIDKETLQTHLIEKHVTEDINSRNIQSIEENPISLNKSVIVGNEIQVDDVPEVFACINCNMEFNSSIDIIQHNFDCRKLSNKTNISDYSSINESQCDSVDEVNSSVIKQVQNESNIRIVSDSPNIIHSDEFEASIDSLPVTKEINLKKRKKIKLNNEAVAVMKKSKRKNVKKDLNGTEVDKKYALDCSMCGKRFRSMSDLKRHETSHDPDKPYHCMMGRCRWSFGTESDLEIHMNVNHREDGNHQCDFCHKVFAHRRNLRQHMLQHKSTKRFICTYCNKGFTHMHHFKNHVRLHTNELPFLCQICGAAFPTKDRLKAHSNRHSDVRPFTCEQCNKTFVTEHDLKYHTKRHTAERIHMCSACGKTYTTRAQLNLHVESAHDKVTRETMAGKCKICGIILPMTELNQHLKIHTCQYFCTLCPKSFPLTSALEAHIKTHSMGDRSHVCSKCGSGFNRASHLRGHVARCHDGGASLPCPHCPNKFASKPDLTSHIRTHTGERPYVCKECDKGFSQSHSLRVHMRTHTGEQPYICGSCHKAHRSASALSHHMRTHTTVLPQQKIYKIERNLQQTPLKLGPSGVISVIQNQQTSIQPLIKQMSASPATLSDEQQDYTNVENEVTCQENEISFVGIGHDIIIKNEDVIVYD